LKLFSTLFSSNALTITSPLIAVSLQPSAFLFWPIADG
jgi:hypothetical protein